MKKEYLLVTFAEDSSVRELILTQPRLGERKLKYKRAKQPTQTSLRPRYLSGVTKLFVGGLPSKVNKREFEEYFGRFGKIRQSILPKKSKSRSDARVENKGHGFVIYRDTESARKVLEEKQGHYIREKRVDIQIAKPRRKNSPNYKAYNNYNSLKTNASAEDTPDQSVHFSNSAFSAKKSGYVDFLFSSDSDRIQRVINKRRVRDFGAFNDGVSLSKEERQRETVVSEVDSLLSLGERRRSERRPVLSRDCN